MGSVYGKNIRVSIFGQSHSPAVGVVVDGLPAGFRPDMEALRAFMRRRAPGRSLLSTQRTEADLFEVLSGMANGRLCGAPFMAVIRNADVRPQDYAGLTRHPRPGHADYPAQVRYRGHQDASGGGHFSGRLTAPLCLAGGLLIQMLESRGILIGAQLLSVGQVEGPGFDPMAPQLDSLTEGYLRTLRPEVAQRMEQAIDQARLQGDSLGGVVECAAVGLPVGVGEPMFEGLENRIAQAVFGIPAVKGLAFGSGFEAPRMRGSQHNDAWVVEDEQVRSRTNRHGGILGGLSTGMPLLFQVAFKPTSSIFTKQDTVDLQSMQPAKLELKGRHDPCIVPRAVPVVEAACAMALFDALMDYDKGEQAWT